jgi:hypothetical protein
MSVVVEIEPWRLSGTLVFRASDPGLYVGPRPDAFDAWDVKRKREWHGEQYQPVLDWLEQLGLSHVKALAMFQHPDGRYLLAVTQLCLDDNGSPYIDLASDRVATRYRVIDLGVDATWPSLFDLDFYRTESGKWH